MTTKRKVKKEVIMIIFIISFFAIYFIGFNIGIFLDKDSELTSNKSEEYENTKSLMSQISSKNRIYLSDSNVENIRIEEEHWEELKFLFREFSTVRTPSNYNPIYSGYSEDIIRFSTDMNYFRVYTVTDEEYYKIPVELKEDFEQVLNDSIYTSFDLLKQHNSWKNVEIVYGSEVKSIHRWKYTDLSYKIASKRMVGRIQPEKSRERSDYNFTINIEGKDYKIVVETMGKDYIKITSGEAVAYYEVHTALYEYLRDDIFKLEE